MAKKQDRLGAIAQAAQKVKNSTADQPVELKQKYVMSEGIAAQRGARTGWNPAEAKAKPVTTTYPSKSGTNPFINAKPDENLKGGGSRKAYLSRQAASPYQRANAILDEAVAARKAVSPKPVQASRSVSKQAGSRTAAPALSPAESFNRMPASGSAPRPNRSGASYKAGSAADMAYTGVKPAAAPKAATARPKPKASLPAARMPSAAPAAPVAKPRSGLSGKLVGFSIVANAAQAAYYEVKRRKNQNKPK